MAVSLWINLFEAEFEFQPQVTKDEFPGILKVIWAHAPVELQGILRDDLIIRSKEDGVCRTSLHHAVMVGHYERTKWLLTDVKSDPNKKDTDGSTAMHMACKNGDIETVKLLYEGGADPNCKDKSGCTPALIASSNGHVEIIKYLHQVAKINMDTSEEDGAMRPLHAAIAGTHADVVLYLLSIPCDTTVKVLYEGLQFDAFELVEAVTGDETNSTRKAMDYGQRCGRRVPQSFGYRNWTYAVAAQRDAENVEALKDVWSKAPEDMKEAIKYHIKDTISSLVQFGRKECIQYVVTTIQGSLQETELGDRLDHIMNACKLGHVELLQYFAEDLSYPWKEWKDGVGRGPFHKACESGNVAIVKCLVDVYDHYSGSGDRWGVEPISIAAAGGHLDVVQYLLTVHSVSDGLTEALQAACENNRVDVVKYLYDTSKTSVVDCKAQWLKACCAGRLDIGLTLWDHCGVNKATSQEELTAALFDTHANLKGFQFLIESCGADPNSLNTKGVHIFMHACYKDQVSVAKYLVETCHIDPNVREESTGATSLHLVGINSDVDTCIYLLSLGCDDTIEATGDVMYETFDHETAVQAASRGPRRETMWLLQEYAKEKHGTVVEHKFHFQDYFDEMSLLRFRDDESTIVEMLQNAPEDTVDVRLGYIDRRNTKASDANEFIPVLQWASRYNRVMCLKSVLKRMADTLSKNDIRDAFKAAVVAGSLDSMKCILSTTTFDDLFNDPEGEGDEYETYIPLRDAVEYGHTAVVEYLNETMGIDVDTCDLQDACSYGHLDIVNYLTGPCEMTPTEDDLTAAAENGHLDVVKHLVETHKVAVNYDILGRLSDLGHFSVILYLLTHGDAVGQEHMSDAFHHACKHGRLDILEYLIGAGVKPPNDEGYYLKIAAGCGSVPVLRCLREKCKFESDPGSYTSSSPLGEAIRKGHVGVVRYFMSIGCTTTTPYEYEKSWDDTQICSPLALASGSILEILTSRPIDAVVDVVQPSPAPQQLPIEEQKHADEPNASVASENLAKDEGQPGPPISESQSEQQLAGKPATSDGNPAPTVVITQADSQACIML